MIFIHFDVIYYLVFETVLFYDMTFDISFILYDMKIIQNCKLNHFTVLPVCDTILYPLTNLKQAPNKTKSGNVYMAL